MKNPLILLAGAAFSLILAQGCYYDKEDELYTQTNGTTCDTTSITYSSGSNTITSIFSVNCSTGNTACHKGDASSSGIDLSTYAAVSTYEDNNPGAILGSILQDGSRSNMPKGGSKLTDCNIAKFRNWVALGKPQ